MTEVSLRVTKEQATALQELQEMVQQAGGEVTVRPTALDKNRDENLQYWTVDESTLDLVLKFAGGPAAIAFLHFGSKLMKSLVELKAVRRFKIRLPGLADIEGHPDDLDQLCKVVKEIADTNNANLKRTEKMDSSKKV